MQGITKAAPQDGDAVEWAAECSRYPGADVFPARQDDLLAVLVHERAPSRLLHYVATLDPGTVYTSLDDVLADCGADLAVEHDRVGPAPA